MTNLLDFRVFNNRLTGSIPAGFSALKNLQYFQVDRNNLTGNINFIDPVHQKALLVIDIGVNALTGTIPEAVFQLPSLEIFSASSNCFQGSLPKSLCTANNRLSRTLLSEDNCSGNCCADRSDSFLRSSHCCNLRISIADEHPGKPFGCSCNCANYYRRIYRSAFISIYP
jgi:hypothetical protein